MAKSGLIHAVFKKVIPSRDTPYAALIGFSMMSFVLNIVTHFYTELVNYFDLVTSLSSFIVFISALIAYITFHKKYSVLERYFASPLGVIGAYVGILIFLLCFVGGMAFQDSYIPGTMVIAVAVISALYFIFFSKGQTFSEEEKDELFKAYLVNGKCFHLLELISGLTANTSPFSKCCSKE
jgi:amino acid transporter